MARFTSHRSASPRGSGLVAGAAASIACALLLAIVFSGLATATRAENAAPDRLRVAVHVSSDANGCFTPGLVSAVRFFTEKLAETVNSGGGLGGRKLDLVHFDDNEDPAATIENVRTALSDPNTIAMIGVPSSTRGRAVFDALGDEIRTSEMPFINEMSLDTIFRDWPNVFTMASSVRNELEVVQKMISAGGYARPVFVGVDDDLYSFALEDGVATIPGGPELAGRFRIPLEDYKLTDEVAETTAKQVADLAPDLIVLSIHSRPSAELLRELKTLGVRAPVLVLLGRIATVSNILGDTPYEGTLSQIAREGVPNVYSERLRRRIWRSPDQQWVFPDLKRPETPGWQDGKCQLDGGPPRAVYDAGNTRAVGRGTEYRDMLELIAESVRSAPDNLSVLELRRHIADHLRRFVEGTNVLKGLWRDWAFTANRTAAGDTLLLTKNPGDPSIVLSPVQYQRINGVLHESTTLYTSIDLVSLSHINTNDQSFDAEFYLSMKSKDNHIRIGDIDFTNAYRSQAVDGKLLTVREIHSGAEQSNFQSGVLLYKVSGKFLFEPELSRYPFDAQRFSVSFQPASTRKAFLIQPPPARQRLADVNVDGWRLTDEYVGADQDIIPTIGETMSSRRIVPFYKFNATWIANRISIDYYTRVVIPLGFILLVTYFSVYLPHARFESSMGIQVTALLSSIALYLALPKVDTEQATLSDKIFMITYAAVSLMIGLSILKDNIYKTPRRIMTGTVTAVQRLIFPAVVLGTMYMVIAYDRLPNVEALIAQAREIIN